MKLFLIAISTILFLNSYSQRISKAEYKLIHEKEDSLKGYARQIIEGTTPGDMLIADSLFTRQLVRALKVKNSFYYPFDSLLNISRLTPPDSTFRIFTWQMVLDDNHVRQHGAIQMRTTDGSLKLFPLVDRSDVTEDMSDTIADNFGWMGAIYYKILETHDFGKNFYTLLGYDENNIRSNKKIIEVLTFPKGAPLFGGPYFSYQDNSMQKKFPNRFVLEYKKHAGPRLTFDQEQNMIIYEHLISETNEPSKKYTYIPDGDYEGLKWLQGKWVHISKVFTFKLEDGQAPVPSPLKTDHGTIDHNEMLTEDNSDEKSVEVTSKKTTGRKKKIKND